MTDWPGGSAPKDSQESLLKTSNSDWVLNSWSFNCDLTWSQDLMKLRFLTPHHRKNSLRDKVIGMRQDYLERNTPDKVWAISEGESTTGVWGCHLL